MNSLVIPGVFHGNTDTYRSKNGAYLFKFQFFKHRSYVDIYCIDHPSFNGKDSDPHKTHLYRSGKICFVEGKEPTSLSDAKKFAAQWAEYFVEYRRTGTPQH